MTLTRSFIAASGRNMRDPAMQDAVRRDIFINLLRELQAGKSA
jgi:hypothetical protein